MIGEPLENSMIISDPTLSADAPKKLRGQTSLIHMIDESPFMPTTDNTDLAVEAPTEPVVELTQEAAPMPDLEDGVDSIPISQEGSYNFWALRVRGYGLPQLPIKFQDGNPAVFGVNGWTNEQILTALRSRLAQQNARLSSPHNNDALIHLRMAAECLERRNFEQSHSPLAGMHITNTPSSV